MNLVITLSWILVLTESTATDCVPEPLFLKNAICEIPIGLPCVCLVSRSTSCLERVKLLDHITHYCGLEPFCEGVFSGSLFNLSSACR